MTAFDADGREVPFECLGGDYHGEKNEVISASGMARVSELRLEVKPYQWAEFRDIELHPKRLANYRPISAPLPVQGFSHTFQGGLTIQILGVTEKRAGRRWWQPEEGISCWWKSINSLFLQITPTF